MCVRACVRACVHACVCLRVRAHACVLMHVMLGSIVEFTSLQIQPLTINFKITANKIQLCKNSSNTETAMFTSRFKK